MIDPNTRFGPNHENQPPVDYTPMAEALAAAFAPKQPEKRKKASYVGTPAIFLLELACKPISDAFGGFGCYLVGSALERPDWRDIDVRFIMSDEEFQKEFPGTYDPARKLATWEFDPKWILLSTGIAAYLAKATGLPVDFQFQPQTHANERHKGIRHALGMRFAKVGDDD